MSTGAVSITFDNRVAEHIAADRLYYNSTAWAKGDKIAAAVLILAGSCLVYSAGVRWWSVAPFFLAVLEWFNLLSPRPLLRRYWFKRNPKFQETYHLTFDDTGMHFQTASIDSHINWDYYTRVIENDRMWLLMYGSDLYSLIPKRAFKNEEERLHFREFLAQNISASSRR